MRGNTNLAARQAVQRIATAVVLPAALLGPGRPAAPPGSEGAGRPRRERDDLGGPVLVPLAALVDVRAPDAVVPPRGAQ
jgi:hypothetical protein